MSTDLRTGLSVAGIQRDAFVNRYLPPRRMLIVGAVQIAQSLATMCREIQVEPVIIDPRRAFLTEERFPNVRLDDRWPEDAIPSYRPAATTAVITLSHSAAIDDSALGVALRTEAGYIAALGSRRNHSARLERLDALGFASTDLARIEGPAGLAIGALNPGEIAVSITASAVQRFGGQAARAAIGPAVA